MKCPFRKIITVKSGTTYDYPGAPESPSEQTMEDFAECYKFECPYYNTHEQCEKIKQELNSEESGTKKKIY